MSTMKLTEILSLATRISHRHDKSTLASVMENAEPSARRALLNMLLVTFDMMDQEFMALYGHFGLGHGTIARDWEMGLLLYRTDAVFKAAYHFVHQQLTAVNTELEDAA